MTSKERNSLPQELIFISYSKFKIIFCSKEGSPILLNKVTINEEQCSKKKKKLQLNHQEEVDTFISLLTNAITLEVGGAQVSV